MARAFTSRTIFAAVPLAVAAPDRRRAIGRSFSGGWLRPMLLLGVLAAAGVLPLHAAPAKRTVTVGGEHFIVDGKPVQIISGSIHYTRVPRPYWRARLAMAKAMGLNAITMYVFWNEIEPQRGQWDFTGQNDVAAFIRLAQQQGLYVILRPGPYVCAEWSFGGYPAWLLKDPKIRVRTPDPAYMQAAQDYMNHLGEQLKPLLWTNGGPILAVQVENEYGSFGKDQHYLQAVKQMVVHAGLGDAVLYTADGPGAWGGALPELPEAIDVGPGQVQKGFAALEKFRPNSPLMYIAEYYPGWFDSWGQPHHSSAPIEKQLADMQWVLAHGYSISLYMFHGGTDWGLLNGANVEGGTYSPQTTSYDYSAPLDEAGDPTPAYYAYRKFLTAYAPHHTLPPVPTQTPLIHVASFTLPQAASLWQNLPAPQSSGQPLTFSQLGLQTGYALYRTQLHGPMHGQLDLGGARDYAIVYLNGHEIGRLDRRLAQHALSLDVPTATAQLDILVEDSGRVNFGAQFPDDRKGLIFPVRFDGHALHGWENYALPVTTAPTPSWNTASVAGPAFHRGSFTLQQVGDTYLDVSQLGKGALWVNGHAVGRVWKIGPQQSDYIPACWLHRGQNSVVVFDLDTEKNPLLTGRRHHVYALQTAAR